MKNLVFVGIFSLLTVSVLASEVSIPAFFWSGKNYFSGKNVEVLENINALDVESSFDQITKSSSPLTGINALKTYINAEATTKPEVVVLFVASKLRVDQITHFSDASNADSNGGAFIQLKDALSTAASSLVAPYTSGRESFVDPLVEHLAASAGRVFVAQKGNFFLANLRNKKNVRFISLDQLSDLSSENIFNNGVTDVIVIEIDTDNSLRSFQAADQLVGQVEEMVSKATSGNYVSLFTGRAADKPKVAQPALGKKRVSSTTNSTNPYIDTDATFWRYFPAGIWEVYVVSIPLLIILGTGLSCLCMVQTPDKFEGGTRGRQ